MHILLIHQAFAAIGEPGGTRHHELALYLASRGHRVTVIASPVSYLTGSNSQSTEREPSDAGVHILRAYTYPALHRSFVHRVFSFLSFMVSSFVMGLRVRDVDLVWGTSPPIFQGVTAWSLSRIKRIPFLFEVRDLWPAFAVQVGVLRQPVLIRLSEWLERFLYQHADRVMINSPGFLDHVQQRGASEVTLVPNGADPHMFNPADRGDVFRLSHHLEGCFVALYAGAHGMSNDLGVILEAADRLRDQPRVRVLFVGDGKEKSALIAQAQAMGLDNVLFLDPVPKTEIGVVLAGADACIAILKPIPLYATVYPNKVFDYMAAGRPIVLAIDGVIRQVVEDAQAGIFSAPGNAAALANAIGFLAEHPDEAQRMGNQGRRYIESNFDRSALGEKLERVLKAMIKPDDLKL